MSQLDNKAAAATTKTEDAITGLFLTALEAPVELMCVEGVAARPLTGHTGRTITAGIDSGAAATVTPVSQLTDYPLEPNR